MICKAKKIRYFVNSSSSASFRLYLFISFVLSVPVPLCLAFCRLHYHLARHSCFTSILVFLRPSLHCSFILFLLLHPMLHTSLSSTALVCLQESYSYCAFVSSSRVFLSSSAFFMFVCFLRVPVMMRGTADFCFFSCILVFYSSSTLKLHSLPKPPRLLSLDD